MGKATTEFKNFAGDLYDKYQHQDEAKSLAEITEEDLSKLDLTLEEYQDRLLTVAPLGEIFRGAKLVLAEIEDVEKYDELKEAWKAELVGELKASGDTKLLADLEVHEENMEQIEKLTPQQARDVFTRLVERLEEVAQDLGKEAPKPQAEPESPENIR